MDFTELTAYLDSIPALGVPGCDMAVYQNHKLLYRHSAGFRDAEKTQPVRPDDTYWLFSCTKLFTTCAVMQLIEQGKINLDDPVSAYLPAYARMAVKDGDGVRPAKRVMTIRHLMSMQSGLNYHLDAPSLKAVLKETNRQANTRQIVDALLPHARLHAEDVSDKVQVLDAAHEVVEVGVVRDVGQTVLGLQRVLADGDAVDIDLALVKVQDADRGFQGRGLAGAVVADEAVDLARRDVQAQIVYGDLVAEGFCQMFDTQHGAFLQYV